MKKKPLSETMAASSSDDSTSTSTAAIQNIVERLKIEHNCDKIRKTYHSVWRQFNKFYLKLDIKPQMSEDQLILFVGYLISSGKRSSTVKSYISAMTVMKFQQIAIYPTHWPKLANTTQIML